MRKAHTKACGAHGKLPFLTEGSELLGYVRVTWLRDISLSLNLLLLKLEFEVQCFPKQYF